MEAYEEVPNRIVPWATDRLDGHRRSPVAGLEAPRMAGSDVLARMRDLVKTAR